MGEINTRFSLIISIGTKSILSKKCPYNVGAQKTYFCLQMLVSENFGEDITQIDITW